MSDVIKGINTIVDFIRGLIDFVVNLVQDLIYVVQLLAETVVKLPSYFGWLPAGVVALLVTIFAIVVIYKILGREG